MNRRFLSLVPGAAFPLLLAGCAFMPPGRERAEFQEPPSMERTLSKASRQGAAAAVKAWPEDECWRQLAVRISTR